MNKPLYVFGALLIAGFAVLGIMEMIKAQTPYVTTVGEAQLVGDRPLQFMGTIVRAKTVYDERSDELRFVLSDAEGGMLPVRYKGVKPAGFDAADKVVVRGKCVGGDFLADRVLLKCPSRYRSK